MLNKFKNVLYGTSGSSDDSSITLEDETREAVLSNRVRSAITRSSSFREDLLNGGSRNRATTNINRVKDTPSENSTSNPIHENSQYSLTRRSIKGIQRAGHGYSAKQSKYPYQRPEFLQLKSEDEILVSADHQIRPIILPRDVSRLPWRTGYAECINAGKSLRNEDQAICYQGVAVPQPDTKDSDPNDQIPVPIYESIPWTYFAMFDGHAGSAVAITAANELHHVLAEKLNSIAKELIESKFRLEDKKLRSKILAQEGYKEKDPVQKDIIVNKQSNLSDSNEISTNTDTSNVNSDICDNLTPEKQSEVSEKESGPQIELDTSGGTDLPKDDSILEEDDLPADHDLLIRGALESAFWDMDAQIGSDKRHYWMPGGCTAIAALFILGKLYVCNAGDSRAVFISKSVTEPMSHDYTPVTERKRLNRLGLQCPELLCDTFTQIEYLPKHPTKSSIGTKMLYRDAYMTGFAMKTIMREDIKYPLVCGEGKRSRLLATIGVTRGFGDHEMRSQYGSVPIKPFLTPEPSIKVLDIAESTPIEEQEITANDVLIIGTDGLWDVTSLTEAQETVADSFKMFPENEESRAKYRYMTAAQDLIIQARGQSRGYSVWLLPGPTVNYASHDDIAVFVIPLKPYKQEYEEWKLARVEALEKAIESKRQETFDLSDSKPKHSDQPIECS